MEHNTDTTFKEDLAQFLVEKIQSATMSKGSKHNTETDEYINGRIRALSDVTAFLLRHGTEIAKEIDP